MKTSLLCTLLVFALALPSLRADDESPFSSTTIDLGVVVSNVEKSVEFYTKVIGFKEVKGFKVPGEMAKDSGLTDGKPFAVRVLKLGDGDSATKLKLIQFEGVESKKSDESFIDATLGYSYITIFVKDTNAAVKKLEAAGVKPLVKGPVELPKGFPKGVFLTLVRDPDGNIVELVGPKK